MLMTPREVGSGVVFVDVVLKFVGEPALDRLWTSTWIRLRQPNLDAFVEHLNRRFGNTCRAGTVFLTSSGFGTISEGTCRVATARLP